MRKYQNFRLGLLLLSFPGSLHATQVNEKPPSSDVASWLTSIEKGVRNVELDKELLKKKQKFFARAYMQAKFVRKEIEQVIKHQQQDKLQVLLGSEELAKEVPRIKELGLIACCSIAKEHQEVTKTAIANVFGRPPCGPNGKTDTMVALIMSYLDDAHITAVTHCLLNNGANPFIPTIDTPSSFRTPISIAVEIGSTFLVRLFLKCVKTENTTSDKEKCQTALMKAIREKQDINLVLPFLQRGIYYPGLLHGIVRYLSCTELATCLKSLSPKTQEELLVSCLYGQTVLEYILLLGYGKNLTDFKRKAMYLILNKSWKTSCSSRKKRYAMTYALWLAVRSEDTEMVDYILQHARSIINLHHLHPGRVDPILLEAFRKPHSDIIDLLLQYGAGECRHLPTEIVKEVIHEALVLLYRWNEKIKHQPVGSKLKKLVVGYTREAHVKHLPSGCQALIVTFCDPTKKILSMVATLLPAIPDLNDLDYGKFKEKEEDLIQAKLFEIFEKEAARRKRTASQMSTCSRKLFAPK